MTRRFDERDSWDAHLAGIAYDRDRERERHTAQSLLVGRRCRLCPGAECLTGDPRCRKEVTP